MDFDLNLLGKRWRACHPGVRSDGVFRSFAAKCQLDWPTDSGGEAQTGTKVTSIEADPAGRTWATWWIDGVRQRVLLGHIMHMEGVCLVRCWRLEVWPEAAT